MLVLSAGLLLLFTPVLVISVLRRIRRTNSVHYEDEHDNLLQETKINSSNRSEKNGWFYFALTALIIFCSIVPDESILLYFDQLFTSHDNVNNQRDCELIASRYSPENLIGIYRYIFIHLCMDMYIYVTYVYKYNTLFIHICICLYIYIHIYIYILIFIDYILYTIYKSMSQF
jgi:hypothetical protein